MEEQQQGQPVSGQTPRAPSDDKKIAWVAYLFGWITGLILFLVKKDEYVRFHAMQSIILFGGLHILQIVLWSGVGYRMMGGVWSLIQLAVFVLWIVLMVKAHKGERFKLPVIGDLAEKWAK